MLDKVFNDKNKIFIKSITLQRQELQSIIKMLPSETLDKMLTGKIESSKTSQSLKSSRSSSID